MLFFQLDLPHRAFICKHNLLIMFWISQVLYNLVVNMTIPHEWNWSSFPVLLLGILFVHQDRCKLFSRISFFGRNNPTGLLFSYSTTTIPWWWSEELKLCQLDSLAMALKKKKTEYGLQRILTTSQLASRRCFFESGCCIFNDVCFVVFAMWCTFIFSNFMQVFTPTFSQTRAKLT